MGADDLARRRATKATKAVRDATAGAKPPARRRAPKTPPFWRWMAAQRYHTDPRCRDAAVHISERWGYTDRYSHARVVRALTAEDSAHLVGAKMLADEYFRIFQVDEDSQLDVAGTTGLYYPFEPEVCGRCTRDAVPGTGLCARHGGQWVTESDREEVSAVIAARMDILSERATRVLEDLLDHARSEKVRLDAANSILDRAGFAAVQRVQIEAGQAQSPAEVIVERLDALSGRASAIVDAEVVGE